MRRYKRDRYDDVMADIIDFIQEKIGRFVRMLLQ